MQKLRANILLRLGAAISELLLHWRLLTRRRDPLLDRYMGVTHVHGGVEAVESIHEAVAKGYACRQRFN